MKKRWMVLFLFLGLLLTAAPVGMKARAVSAKENEEVEAPRENQLYAQSATLLDAVSGRILYEKNGTQYKSNASTTKIMTCILVLELVPDLTTSIPVSAYAARQPKVHLGMREGESYPILDLLHSMMLESHNDSAVALAEYVGREILSQDNRLSSQEAVLLFADEMNRKAAEIGCVNTCFVTPNGLDATRTKESIGLTQSHGTTANDLALIMAYCILKSPCKEQFLDITRRQAYRVVEQTKGREFACRNRNALLTKRQDAISGKTGFTAKAGYCYVGAIASEGRTYCIALLGAGWPNRKNDKWKDCETLFSYGIEQFRLVKLDDYLKQLLEQVELEVKEGIGEDLYETPCCAVGADAGDLLSLPESILTSQTEEIRVEKNYSPSLEAPVTLGQTVGEATIYLGDQIWKSCSLYTKENVAKLNYKWVLWQLACIYFTN